MQVVAGMLVLAVALGAGGWFGWQAWRGRAAALAVDGKPIVNADQLLARAFPQLQALATLDGAPLPANAGCWFAPPEPAKPGASTGTDPGPRVACGPVRLGIAGDRQWWVVGAPRYSDPTYKGVEVTGTLERFDGVAELDPSLLRRPDGAAAPAGAPAPGGAGVRTGTGRLISNAGPAITAADTAFAQAAAASKASSAPESRCYLGVRDETRAGVLLAISTGDLWCGPVLLTDSAPGALWVSTSPGARDGDALVDATLPTPTFGGRLSSTRQLPVGTRLVRPDGLQPPAGDAGLKPPSGAAVAAGTVTLLDALPAGDQAAGTPPTAKDPRLVTPSLTLTLTGLGVAAGVGTGKDAVVAADGEHLVVARFTVTRADGGPSGNGTASLVVDGRRAAVREWSSVRDSGVLLASVPTGATDVRLEVVSEGRAQAISLLTGERAPGGPAALYRAAADAAPAAPVKATVALPKGNPAGATGTVAQLRLRSWTRDDGWAPAGRAFLGVVLDGWQLRNACCAYPKATTTATWSVKLPDGTTVAQRTAAPGTAAAREPVIVVPETLTKGTLVLTLKVTYPDGTATKTATAPPVAVPFEVAP